MAEPRLTRRGLVGGAAAGLGLLLGDQATAGTEPPPITSSMSWGAVRAQFALDPQLVQLTSFLFASHPAPVRRAIERHRRGLDANPHGYLEQEEAFERRVVAAAARFLRTDGRLIALTDSTTMALGLLYRGLRLQPGDDLLTSTHDFYSTHEALRARVAATGASVRKVQLYKDPSRASADEILTSLAAAIRPRTRAIALTWVHSSTGVKLPLRQIAALVRGVNEKRDRDNHALLCIDGVHGFGVEEEAVGGLGCDFFASGTHKWLFGPRGTGFLWGTGDAWRQLSPSIPSFDRASIGAWLFNQPAPAVDGPTATPGGYHSFEHRWALAEAFEFRQTLGAKRVAQRTHALAKRLKLGLRELKGVTVQTPLGSGLSAGLVCVSIDGVDPRDAVDRLASKHGIVASATPYATQYLRFGPSIVNTEADVDRAVSAVRSL